MLINEIRLTGGILALSMLTVVVMVLLEKRARRSIATTLLPTTPIMFVSGVAAVLSIVHLLNLWGIHTGR